MEPEPASAVLRAEQEAIAMAFRRHTLLPLDEYLYALQAILPHLSHSALHPRAKWVAAADWLRRVLDKLPCKGHTVLAHNGVPLPPQAHQFPPGGHNFDRICWQYDVAPP